ncbi:PqqD family peptide modification chaperone [Nocardiopsis sp. FR26]|uniref:PqqD family peptide modification chaperone n=1 Tax=Nocardiopsis sp. FR26 TaxID=2605987 RepID=UPI00135C894F|nr:PqqD family peptide modification chaperone [Nocardiopsis sp. FR26]
MELKPGVTVTPTGDGAIVLNETTGAMAHLNASAHGCLRAGLDGGGLDAAAAWLADTYGLDSDQARSDAEHALRQLQERGLAR